MRRLAMATVALGLAFTGSAALAQEHEGGGKKPETFAEKYELELKWANFLLLAGVLGYFIGKNAGPFFAARSAADRKSTRLNSSHANISYAVFCLKKNNNI